MCLAWEDAGAEIERSVGQGLLHYAAFVEQVEVFARVFLDAGHSGDAFCVELRGAVWSIQRVGKRDRILHRHASALGKGGQGRVRCIADNDYVALGPMGQGRAIIKRPVAHGVGGLNRAGDLRVPALIKRLEICDFAGAGPAFQFGIGVFRYPDKVQQLSAAQVICNRMLALPRPSTGHRRRWVTHSSGWRGKAPGYSSREAGLVRPMHLFAHNRVQPVRSNEEVSAQLVTRVEGRCDVVALTIAYEPLVELDLNAVDSASPRKQRFQQIGPVDVEVGCIPSGCRIIRKRDAKHPAPGLAQPHLDRFWLEGMIKRNAEIAQRSVPIGRDLKARTNFA